MKKFLLAVIICLIVAGCSSQSRKNSGGTYTTVLAGGIVDEEYDIEIAPYYEYTTMPAYEEQIKVKPQAKGASKKTAKKMTKPQVYKQ